ncbi:MAG TPA: hypothetical protein VMU50_00925, partial [Polyangia bacterium]|nr:hypothetical protein [Polyangia bacterium]
MTGTPPRGRRRRRPSPSPLPLSELAARATEITAGAPPERAVGVRWERLRAALDQAEGGARPRRRWPARAFAAGALVAVAAVATVALVPRLLPGPRVTYAVLGAALGGDGY